MEERFSNLRLEEALGTGADVLVTAEPLCVLNPLGCYRILDIRLPGTANR